MGAQFPRAIISNSIQPGKRCTTVVFHNSRLLAVQQTGSSRNPSVCWSFISTAHINDAKLPAELLDLVIADAGKSYD